MTDRHTKTAPTPAVPMGTGTAFACGRAWRRVVSLAPHGAGAVARQIPASDPRPIAP